MTDIEHRPGRRAVVPDVWSPFYAATHVPAAVFAGDRLRVTGHTGEASGVFPDSAVAQLRQTFRNIGLTLAEAGAGWADVVELTSYHVGLREQSEAMMTVAAEFLEDPYPAWTAVGVTELFEPDALVEISCEAVLPAAQR
jgi:enamine deaminase RidA (YjgF/YER057c/UK114 family)